MKHLSARDPGKATHSLGGGSPGYRLQRFPSCTQALRSSLAKIKKRRKDFKFFVYELMAKII